MSLNIGSKTKKYFATFKTLQNIVTVLGTIVA